MGILKFNMVKKGVKGMPEKAMKGLEKYRKDVKSGKRKAQRIETKLGLNFNIRKCRKELLRRKTDNLKVNRGAAVYMAKVCDYLCTEILEQATEDFKEKNKKRVKPKHIMNVFFTDDNFKEMCKGVSFPVNGGQFCQPPRSVHEALLKKKKGKSQEDASQ